jgi:hypothetical protein
LYQQQQMTAVGGAVTTTTSNSTTTHHPATSKSQSESVRHSNTIRSITNTSNAAPQYGDNALLRINVVEQQQQLLQVQLLQQQQQLQQPYKVAKSSTLGKWTFL